MLSPRLLNLSVEASNRLDELAERWGVSRSVVAETAIRAFTDLRIRESSVEEYAVAVDTARRARPKGKP